MEDKVRNEQLEPSNDPSQAGAKMEFELESDCIDPPKEFISILVQRVLYP